MSNIYLYSLPLLLKGALITAEIAIAGMIFGTLLGVLLVLLRISNVKLLEGLVTLYVSFIRGTPFLIQILIVFYSLAVMGLDFSNSVTGIIAVGLNTAAFISEVFRSGLNAIPKGHIEAGEALGMSKWAIFIRIKMLQVFYIVKPQMVSEFINAIKVTPILSTIGVLEITRVATRIVSRKHHPVPVYIIAFALYFIVCTILEVVQNKMQSSTTTKKK